MRVLLDECVPKALGRFLTGHSTRTVSQEGWSGKKNGELLALMTTAGIDVFLTVDQGLRHQQNLRTTGVAVMIALSVSNDINDLKPLVPGILQALSTIRPGDVIDVSN